VSRLVAARDPATGEAMPDSLIIDNLVTFLLAGHETTAQALTWTLYLLALLPDWQEKAREEIRRVTGNGPIDGHCLGSGETRMAGAFLSGAIAAVDFDATKADVRRAVEDFLAQLFAKAPDTNVARAVAVAAGKIFRNDALQRVLPAACGVELPMRRLSSWTTPRGKPCTPSRLSGLGCRHDACVPGDARLSDEP
jgi:hypothetical protein